MTDINTWFLSLPPVTRYYLAASAAITVITSLQVLSPYSVVFVPDKIAKNFEVWRLLTGFCYFGRFGFGWLFEMAFLIISTRSLEQMPMFINKPKNFYWLIFCEMLLIIALGWYFGLVLLGEPLVFSFLYLGCRYEPEKIFRLLWGFEVKGLYLPFVIMGFRLLSNQPIKGELIGMALGELAYYVKEQVPVQYGRDFLASPDWFESVVDWIAVRISGQQRNNPNAERQQRGFPGRGHRLG